ncbi:MAG: carbohydrate ABC transporter substrate-binding protein, partial [Nevskiales bacterium]
SDPALKAIAADTMHEPMPLGVSKVRPETCLAISATVFKHTKFPNAAKEYIRFMMEAEQYGPWLEGCLGYWCQPLKAYSSMKFWQQDPKLTAYATSMDTPYYHGYKGPISAAAAAVLNNYTLVDMFASVVTGNTTPQEAAKLAARQAERYYKTA